MYINEKWEKCTGIICTDMWEKIFWLCTDMYRFYARTEFLHVPIFSEMINHALLIVCEPTKSNITIQLN